MKFIFPAVSTCTALLLVTVVGTAKAFSFWGDIAPNLSHEDNNDVCSLPNPSAPIKVLYVFGDSFSDVGNIYEASNYTQPPSPPYFPGRYSNGRVYVDFMAQTLGISVSTATDFAWGGATTDNSFIQGTSTYLNASVPSVSEQAAFYSNRVGSGNENMNEALFIINAGYNDYWWYVYDNGTNYTSAYNDTLLEYVANRVTSNLINIMELLVQAGAKRLLIADLPDMRVFPDASTKSSEQVRVYGECSKLHNTFLYDKLEKYHNDHADLDIRLLPFNDTMQSLIDDATCLGMVNSSLTTACLDSSTNSQVCGDPFALLFWDDWHLLTWNWKRVSDAARMVLATPTKLFSRNQQ